MFSARCGKCRSLLFDVPNFQGFNKPSPKVITCRGCGRQYTVVETADGDIIGYRYGNKKSKLKVEQHD